MMSEVSQYVVLGVIGNDTHVVANRILSVGLHEMGFIPVNLGTNNIPSDFADAVVETGAVAVLVSSLNGEAEHWCRGFRQHFRERNCENTVLYLGGNLMIGDRNADQVERRFKEYGFDRVFHRSEGFGPALEALKQDIFNMSGEKSGRALN